MSFVATPSMPVISGWTIYHCHSDLYFRRRERALGNIMDENFFFLKNISSVLISVHAASADVND